jgi:gamma-glutamyltranspeptidase/glutathione hydrolase
LHTHRGMVMSQNGMVASDHTLASWAGAKVLSMGGNAMDAAIATAAVTNVVLPQSCGLGGDAFILYYDSSSKKVTGFNGSGKAPLGAHREYFVEKGFKTMPMEGILSAAVPGQVSAYYSAHERFATWPMEKLFAQAISYAEQGFPVAERTSSDFKGAISKLQKYPSTAKVFLKNGTPPKPGEILVQKDLAETLRTIAGKGEKEFYKGELFEKFMATSKEQGGLFEGEEWMSHQTDVYEPISTTYRGYEIFENNPPSQGLIVLEGLNILEGFEVQDSLSGDAIHYMVEAKKRAYADRLKYMGEPFNAQIVKTLISKSYADFQRKGINPLKVSKGNLAGDPLRFSGNTTYFCVVDKDGNSVSWIHSLSHKFGSGLVAEGTGVLLNNRAGRGFSLVKDHPNVIAPGKKTMHTLNCWLALENGKPRWVGGTPGGDGQPQWNIQLLSHLIDGHMTPQQAVEAPRWLHHPGTDPSAIDQPWELRMEARFDKATVEQLIKKGHSIQMLGDWAVGGRAQIIEIKSENGVFLGGSDTRSDGMAIGI